MSFKVNSNLFNYYGWAKRGSKSFRIQHADSFTSSFIISLSSSKYYGWQGVAKTNNAATFAYYLKKLIQQAKSQLANENDKLVIWWD